MSKREVLYRMLHRAFPIHRFDNTQVWAGNQKVLCGEECQGGDLVRFFHAGPGKPVKVRLSAELYVRGVTENGVDPGDIEARLWTDIDDHGYMDPKGIYRPGFGRYVPMELVRDAGGKAVVRGNNIVFHSAEIEITKCGVYGFTAEFSSDPWDPDDAAKQWLSVNEIAYNKDGAIVVSPAVVATCPSVMEVCPRKYGASVTDDGRFASGTFNHIAQDLPNIPVDVIYLLPFFLPGTRDLLTGEDVRKGKLGSVYAIKDFYKVDPALCSPLDKVDFRELLSEGLLTDYDLDDLLTGTQHNHIRRVGGLAHFDDAVELSARFGEDTVRQLVGRAELRRLVRRAHELGKKVIFDMVIMQTSRDNELIREHIDWYQLDEKGHPRRHGIAWLNYSDVALFRLAFNKPLQSYLTSVVAYWVKTCDLDGIRIDAAQTVDRPFLKQLSNRIQAVKPGAIILGETLCPVSEAVDVSTDMIYSLLVDHHVQIEHARPYIDLLEHYHRTFPRNTVAIAYFENHDSARATQVWHEKYRALFEEHAEFKEHWEGLARLISPGEGEISPVVPVYLAALMKNLQASAINATAGASTGVRLAYCLEMGSDYGETTRTDFESPVLLNPDLAERDPHHRLRASYFDLEALRRAEPLLHSGRVYYFTGNMAGFADRVLCYSRHDDSNAVIAAFNLDPAERQEGTFDLESLPAALPERAVFEVIFDAHHRFGAAASPSHDAVACRVSMRCFNIPDGPRGRTRKHRILKLDLPPLAAVVGRITG